MNGCKQSHDRFLIVDDAVWHIGASLKDAGSALFAMMKMELDPAVILGLLPQWNCFFGQLSGWGLSPVY